MKKLLDRFSETRMLAAGLLAVSLAVLGSAYISQYVFHYDPCVLCLYQRKPWWAVIALSTLGVVLSRRYPVVARKLLAVCVAAFVIGTGLALYHVGVEQQWWPGTAACGDTALPAGGDINALKDYLANRNIVRCDVPTWQLFGLSMTAYNLMASLIMTVVTAFMLQRGRKSS